MGSSTYAASVEAYGHEKEMYRSIKNYLTNLDPRITCDNDVDEEWSGSVAEHIPTLDFKINNTPIFSLYRDKYIDLTSKYINFTLLPSGIPSNSKGIRNAKDQPNEEKAANYDRTRGLAISHIINDNFILLSFAGLSTTVRNNDNVTFALSFTNSVTYIGAAQTGTYDKAHCFDISGYTLYNLTLPSSTGTFISRFSYGAPVGSIDYIKSSVYQSNGSKIFENKAVYDSTTVNVGDAVSLKDGSYVAVGTHQLVKVS